MTFAQALEAISNAYYSRIPHSFGRQRAPIIGTDEALRREVTLLESLGDMEIATAIMKSGQDNIAVNALDRQFAGLGLQEMTPCRVSYPSNVRASANARLVKSSSKEFSLLKEYLIKSHGSTHDIQFQVCSWDSLPTESTDAEGTYQVQHIFRVERSGEADRFTTTPKSNRRLLWHGSRTTNYGGILSQGLRIAPPEAPASGYAFGKGVYLGTGNFLVLPAKMLTTLG